MIVNVRETESSKTATQAIYFADYAGMTGVYKFSTSTEPLEIIHVSDFAIYASINQIPVWIGDEPNPVKIV